ncbi:Rv3235 family protein [Streptosporangium sp. NPDC001559]|uniref:Rv3235 family protein n=1 Tax=Streptosporangium sp. NPDC001559 TaxID=3366187 RepID=UPI0036EDBBF1
MPRPSHLPRVASSSVVEPLYDDERPSPKAAAAPPYVQGALALALDQETGTAGPPGPPPAVPEGRRLRALCQAVAEVLAGLRPPSSVASHLTGRAGDELARSGRVMRCARPPRTGVPHVSQPRDGVVEMCVLVHCGDRSRVLALRLERVGARWLCTDVETAP